MLDVQGPVFYSSDGCMQRNELLRQNIVCLLALHNITNMSLFVCHQEFSIVLWKGLELLRNNGAKPMQKCLPTIFFKKNYADIYEDIKVSSSTQGTEAFVVVQAFKFQPLPDPLFHTSSSPLHFACLSSWWSHRGVYPWIWSLDRPPGRLLLTSTDYYCIIMNTTD